MPQPHTTMPNVTTNDTHPPALRLTIDGRRFKELVRAAFLWLKQNEQTVNAYNVYPVPDGDTGTNMMHTMRAAWDAIAGLDDGHIGNIAKSVSAGALRGSRGNSGIILSQLWRGIARSFDGKEVCDAQDLAVAFREAARTAYAGISQPVEGTILTVARETADAAEYFARGSHDLRALLDTVVKASHESVQRTPMLLKILKDAGVIDSGGYGLYIILDGMRRCVVGEPFEGAGLAAGAKAAAGEAPAGESGYGYDVQYLIYARTGSNLDVDRIRADIEGMGECPLVMGDSALVKVHVHVPDPGVPISYGAGLGSIRDVVVEDMQAQSEAFLPGAPAQTPGDAGHADVVEVAFVPVASGDGIARVFSDVGARAVVLGGQTMNPSVQDWLDAIARAKARHVVLLPNNSNIILTAQQAASLSDVPAHVVPTRTIPQGVAAAIAFNYTQSADANAKAMSAAAARTTTLEITTATRDATINGVTVRSGQLIGLIDDKLAAAGDALEDMSMHTLELGDAESRELITVYYGNGLSEDEARGFADRVQERYPSAVVETHAGNQPFYYYIIGLE